MRDAIGGRTLVTGGARSGKSGFAERYAAALGERGLYVATAQAFDDEMRERLAMHRRQRDRSGFPWHVIEEPHALAELLDRIGGEYRETEGRVVLVDCLTLWLSNTLLRLEADPDLDELLGERIDRLAMAVSRFPGRLLLVTNEVGDGIVPATPLGRRFRDHAGILNRKLAELCEEVFLVTAGIPVELKRLAFRKEGVWPVTSGKTPDGPPVASDEARQADGSTNWGKPSRDAGGKGKEIPGTNQPPFETGQKGR